MAHPRGRGGQFRSKPGGSAHPATIIKARRPLTRQQQVKINRIISTPKPYVGRSAVHAYRQHVVNKRTRELTRLSKPVPAPKVHRGGALVPGASARRLAYANTMHHRNVRIQQVRVQQRRALGKQAKSVAKTQRIIMREHQQRIVKINKIIAG